MTRIYNFETDPILKEILPFYLEYLRELQKGRVKPDRNGKGGSVFDSLDNVPEIEAVKDKINALLDLDASTVDALRTDQKQQKYQKYNNK